MFGKGAGVGLAEDPAQASPGGDGRIAPRVFFTYFDILTRHIGTLQLHITL